MSAAAASSSSGAPAAPSSSSSYAVADSAAGSSSSSSSSSGGDDGAVLPRDLVVRLGDTIYGKRKNAALELEALVKSLLPKKEQQVRRILAMLGNDFMNNPSPNYRKGGLIGLAACGLGCGDVAHKFLDLLMGPVLKCFEDPEYRVRYYACESLYNIAKVVRGRILPYFNLIFGGLCKLSVDVNIDVKNGAILLDGMMKDIVTESESFQVESFIPLLSKYITKTNPHVRQLLVQWITALDSVPDIDMLVWLPTFLEGLFNMLSDVNRPIRSAADHALSDFLREIKQAKHVEFGPCGKSEVGMVAVLVEQCKSKHILARMTAVQWIREFVLIGKEQLVPFFGELLEAVLACVSDREEEIRNSTSQANEALIGLVRRTHAGASAGGSGGGATTEPVTSSTKATTAPSIDLLSLITRLTLNLVNEHEITRMTSLRWISMLLEKCPDEMNTCVDEYFFALLRTLEDPSDQIVQVSLRNLALVSRSDMLFRRVLVKVVELFGSKRSLLENRGSLIVRHLCILLSAEKVYCELATIMQTQEDLEFTALMVQMLNLILLTASELEPLRVKLKGSLSSLSLSSSSFKIFEAVFNSWCHAPVAALSLCFLAQAYDLASVMISHFGDAEITVGFLMQVDKLVQLLESPIFVHLRLQLLDSSQSQHVALMKSLYGLLMLLPQSAAYKTLQNRLTAVSSMHSALGMKAAAAAAVGGAEKDRRAKYDQFIRHFVDIQKRHRDARWRRQSAQSLLGHGDGAAGDGAAGAGD